MQVRWMANPARRGNTRRRGLVTPVLAAGALCLITISLTGCGESGPPRGSVQGFVTWEGTPVENGTISFIPLGDGVAASAPIVGGRYILPKDEGPAVGPNRVQILGLRSLGLREAGPPHPPGTMLEATEQIIPPEYNNSTRLSVDIQEGDNTCNFDLPQK